MTRRLAGFFVLWLTAGLVWAGAAQADLPRSFWGVNFRFGQSVRESDLTRMGQARMGEVRGTFYWAGLEAVQGTFDWTKADAAIGRLASRGLRVLPVVFGTPSWAASTPSSPPTRSAKARAGWRNFLRAVVHRYGPNGAYWTNPALYPAQHPGLPPMPIHAWQIWNEPNLDSYFAPRPSPRRYARLLRISRHAIQSVDPRARIVLGGLVPYASYRGWSFLNRLYEQRGVKRQFDAVTLHPYAYTVGDQGYAIRRTRQVMKRHHDQHTGLWITELGWGSGPRDRFGLNRGPRGQKRLLRRSFQLIVRNRRSWHIKHVFWFQWRDTPHSMSCPGSICHTAGLFQSNMSTKPAWRAFRRFVAHH